MNNENKIELRILNELFKKAEELGWTIKKECETIYCFQKFSPAGQDFYFFVDTENDPDLFLPNLLSVYNDFDVSYETYLWLDDTGHGRNGAPYDMKDVYEDMEACEEMIYGLWSKLSLFYSEL